MHAFCSTHHADTQLGKAACHPASLWSSSSSRRAMTITAAALPKRRKPGGSRRKAKEEPKQLSDEELIRELNSSHLWPPDVEGDFGLDDVAANVASRNQAQVVDVVVTGQGNSSSSSSGGAGGARSKARKNGRNSSSRSSDPGSAASGSSAPAADPQALSEIDPSSGQPMPEWVTDLKQEGFDVMSRDGQLFLQRGNTAATASTQQQQQQQQQKQQPAAAAARSQPSRIVRQQPPTAAGGGGDQVAAAAAAAGALQHVSTRSLSVRAEFDSTTWQQHIQALQHRRAQYSTRRAGGGAGGGAGGEDEDDAAAAAGAAWYASPSSSSSSSRRSSPTDQQSTPAAAPAVQNDSSSSSSGTSSSSSSSSSPNSSRMSAASIQRTLLNCRHPNDLLWLLRAVFPAWSDNGCWLVSQSMPGVVFAPTPAEAAAAIKGLALAARRARLNAVQLQSLAREPLVSGLVEALRLTPPRVPGGVDDDAQQQQQQQQQPDLSDRLWSIAKAYWMQAGPTKAAAAQQQLLGMAGAAGAGAGGAKGQGGPATALGSLLVQLQAQGGGSVSKQQLAAAQALVQARGEDQLRRSAVVCALWGMSVLGGPLFFMQDMEALCRIAQAKFSRWQPSPSELSDVLWALAHARHWTSLLPQLEACLLAAGGLPACCAAEAVTSIWAFAVLGHTPTQLLQQLDHTGWTVKPDSTAANNRRPLPNQQRQRLAAPTTAAAAGGGSAEDGGAAGTYTGVGAAGGNVGGAGVDGGLSSLRDSQLCTLAWSLACLQAVDSAVFKAVWCEVCRRGPSLAAAAAGGGGGVGAGSAADAVRQAVQVAQADLAIQLEGSYAPDELCPGTGTQQLLSAVRGVFRQQGAALQAQKAHSSYQRSIAGILSRLRVMHVMEDISTGYAVDITIPGLRIAIEADGPSHFSRTTPPSTRSSSPSGLSVLRQLGATAMKRRHLQRLGWTVVNVPYSDWDKQTDEQQKVAYLKLCIAAARKKQAAAASAQKAAGTAAEEESSTQQ